MNMRTADSITAEFQRGKELIAQYAKAHGMTVHYDPKGIITLDDASMPYYCALEIAVKWHAGMDRLMAAILTDGAPDA
jgi:hypothetical protein